MNFLKKGPEIKLSSLKGVKAPGFLVDLYWDLRDRHLLPLAVLLVVALVAVPILLSNSADGEEGGDAVEAGTSATVSGANGLQSKALVAEAAPGLRDYRRRLHRLESKNPFKQQYPAESTEGGTGGDESSSGSGAETFSTGSPSSPESGGSPGSPTEPRLTYYSFAIDVRVSGGGEQSQGKATVRRNLPELTMLPSRETPAAIFMDVTKDRKKALMLVSSDVQAVFGDGKCVLGSQTCELLALEPGLPETFVYGGAGRTYTIELLEIKLIESKKLNRAPLGNPKKNDERGRLNPSSAAALGG